MGIEFQFCRMKRVLEMGGDDGCTGVRRCLMLLSLKMVKMGNCMLCVFYHSKKLKGKKEMNKEMESIKKINSEIGKENPMRVYIYKYIYIRNP